MTPSDTLIESYRAAQKLQEILEDSAGPSELTRRRILAHAEQLANNIPSKNAVILPENTTDLIAKKTINTPAANDSQWKIRALTSVAVFGIAGLLMLQLRQEAPEEFLPKAKPSASVERSAEPPTATIAESESKSTADKSVPAPAQAAAPAPKSAPLPEQKAKKSESASRDDLEVSAAKEPKQQNEPRAEGRADKAAEVAQSMAPPPSAASPAAAAPANPAPAISAPAPTPATALTTMADSAKLARSAPAAPRGMAHTTTNANAKLFAAIQTKDAAALKLALDGGDDKNAKNADGTPALSVCVHSEQLNLVRLLIAAGADVNALDARGVSPLTHARNQGFAEIVTFLLASGAK